MDGKKLSLRRKPRGNPPEAPGQEDHRLAPMMRALKAIHSVGAPDSMAPEDLAKQRAAQEVLGRLVAPMIVMKKWEPFHLKDMACAWVKPDWPHVKHRVILYCHGGGYTSGNLGYSRPLASKLSNATGWDTLCFEYRLAPEFQFPAPLEDCNLVVKWMIAHKDEYGFDTENVFAVGDSAGAHGLALYCDFLTNKDYAAKFAFTAPAGFHFNAVALNCGAYRITLGGKEDLTTSLMKEYLPHGGSEEELDLVSCVNYMTSQFPPCFVMGCDGDFLKSQLEVILPVLLKENVPFVLRLYKGEETPLPHVFHCNIKLAEAAQCNDAECAFFKEFCQ